MDKQTFIKLVELCYSLNPDGKGKQRKRTLEQTIDIINGVSSKEALPLYESNSSL